MKQYDLRWRYADGMEGEKLGVELPAAHRLITKLWEQPVAEINLQPAGRDLSPEVLALIHPPPREEAPHVCRES